MGAFPGLPWFFSWIIQAPSPKTDSNSTPSQIAAPRQFTSSGGGQASSTQIADAPPAPFRDV
jgi:hypothetical protein